MADNVGYTPGAGVDLRTDDVSGTQVPVVKVATGADGLEQGFLVQVDADTGGGTDYKLPFVLYLPASGGAAAAPGDTTNGLDVDVTRIVAALPTGTNTIGGVSLASPTSGGLTVYRNVDLDEADVAVKASAGQIYGWFMTNRAASAIYVKFYNASTGSTTVGSTTPFMTIPLLTGQASNVWFGQGIPFSTAITAACVTGVADSSTGAPAANDCVVNIFYA